MEISNKTIFYLVIAALFVSAGGTFLSLNKLSQLGYMKGITGFAANNQTGKVNLSVTNVVEINLTDNSINFGSGYVSEGFNCTMNSEGSSSPNCQGSWSSVNDVLTLVNIGNQPTALYLWVEKNASMLMNNDALDNMNFSLKVKSSQPVCGGTYSLQTYQDVDAYFQNGSSNGVVICNTGNKFGYVEGVDTLNITAKLRVPVNLSGTLGSMINITATG